MNIIQAGCYCIVHQGNATIYDKDTCTVCRLRAEVTRLTAALDEARKERDALEKAKGHLENLAHTFADSRDAALARAEKAEAENARLRDDLARWQGQEDDGVEWWECVECGRREHGTDNDAPFHTRGNHQPVCHRCGE